MTLLSPYDTVFAETEKLINTIMFECPSFDFKMKACTHLISGMRSYFNHDNDIRILAVGILDTIWYLVDQINKEKKGTKLPDAMNLLINIVKRIVDMNRASDKMIDVIAVTVNMMENMLVTPDLNRIKFSRQLFHAIKRYIITGFDSFHLARDVLTPVCEILDILLNQQSPDKDKPKIVLANILAETTIKIVRKEDANTKAAAAVAATANVTADIISIISTPDQVVRKVKSLIYNKLKHAIKAEMPQSYDIKN